MSETGKDAQIKKPNINVYAWLYVYTHLSVQSIGTYTQTHSTYAHILLNLASGTPDFWPQDKSISNVLDYLNH